MIFQFIVNDMLIQSLSMSAVSGWAFGLEIVGRAADQEPRARRLRSEEERRVPGDDPLAELVVDPVAPDLGRGVEPEFDVARLLVSPRQVAVKPTGFLIHQPV